MPDRRIHWDGVYRSAPDLMSRDAYREHLQDAELCAAAERVGAWACTDWSKLRGERVDQRQDVPTPRSDARVGSIARSADRHERLWRNLLK